MIFIIKQKWIMNSDESFQEWLQLHNIKETYLTGMYDTPSTKIVKTLRSVRDGVNQLLLIQIYSNRIVNVCCISLKHISVRTISKN
jgi:hypothetical protein